jgi:outer membrane protein OmpA-like peptidoglycan-associated protein
MSRSALIPLLLVCLVYGVAARGQSHDPKHPTPLAPGLNKGNVDTTNGPVYYYFYGEPGRIDFRMAFHEMGLFGNPLRQSLTFALSDETGKVFFTQPVVSQGNLGEVSNHGTFNKHMKVLVSIRAQQAINRMGGYYEFSVTGDARFDGKAGSSANVKPEDTSLTTTQKNGPVNLTPGSASLTSGPVSLTAGTTSLTSGTTSLTAGRPVQLVYPGQALTVKDSPRELRILLAADVLFDFNKANIRPDAVPTLRQAVARMKAARTQQVIRVEGYTDSKGTDALNLRLSEERAEAVETWFIQNAGMPVSAFSPKGYGAARPVAPNQKPDGQDNPSGRQLNRRVEIVVTK